MTRLTLDRLEKHYGTALAVDAVSLDIAPGEMVVLLGPSGCGKTTTLRMVAGFVPATSGDVLLDGQSILALPPYRREMGLVFQSYALFPHMTVADNIGFGLEMRGMKREPRRQRVLEMLRLARLEPLAERLPRQLSGGQQQRVALARALAINPRVLLLDEPLSNLDASLRAEVGRDIRLLQRDAGLTTIMVTHDQEEALSLADTVAVMDHGRVEQVGTPEQIYHQPATRFVADFVGQSNWPPVTVRDDGKVELAGHEIPVAGSYPAGAARLFCRPEDIQIASLHGPSPIMALVESLEFLGPVRRATLRLERARDIVLQVDLNAKDPWIIEGQTVPLQFPPDRLRLFSAEAV